MEKWLILANAKNVLFGLTEEGHLDKVSQAARGLRQRSRVTGRRGQAFVVILRGKHAEEDCPKTSPKYSRICTKYVQNFPKFQSEFSTCVLHGAQHGGRALSGKKKTGF